MIASPDHGDELKPCPSCPDGNEWDSNGPTGRACKTCGGHAMINLDGSKLRPEQIKEVS